jgi:signal transduction histidine kinase
MSNARLAGALAILFFFGMTLVLTIASPKGVFEDAVLLFVTNIIVSYALVLAVCWTSATEYLETGSPTLLLMGFGVMAYGASLVTGSLLNAIYGLNTGDSVHDILMLSSSIVLFAAATFASIGSFSVARHKRLALSAAYSAVPILAVVVTIATVQGSLPTFFVQGVGPTWVRQLVLGVAMALFATSFLVFAILHIASRLSFHYWYSLALGLIAVSLLATLLESSVGGPLGWVGRAGQWLGGIYFIVAVESTRRFAVSKGVASPQILAGVLTERPKMIAEIESLARFPFENPNPVMRLNLDKILYANPSSQQVLLSLGTGVGERPPEFLRNLAADVLATRLEKSIDYSLGDRTYEIVVAPVAESDYVNLYWRNITKRKQAEELRDRFVSAVTHELRTPLVSVKGYTDYMLKANHDALPSKVEKGLRVVKDEAERLLKITDDLLDYRRLTEGRYHLDLKEVDMRTVLETSGEEIEAFTATKKQTLRFEVSQEPLVVNGDFTRLVQVCTNLLSNASKFTGEGEEITLKACRENNEVKVSVTDGGIGIKAADLLRVFEPFAAIEKPAYVKGTGLGLSVTKGLVEAHKGRIWAESNGLGKGATFTFTLPLLRQ